MPPSPTTIASHSARTGEGYGAALSPFSRAEEGVLLCGRTWSSPRTSSPRWTRSRGRETAAATSPTPYAFSVRLIEAGPDAQQSLRRLAEYFAAEFTRRAEACGKR